jgi:hypothetical protein
MACANEAPRLPIFGYFFTHFWVFPVVIGVAAAKTGALGRDPEQRLASTRATAPVSPLSVNRHLDRPPAGDW